MSYADELFLVCLLFYCVFVAVAAYVEFDLNKPKPPIPYARREEDA